MYKIIIILAMTVFLSACMVKRVAVNARFPAAYPEATQLKKIIVLGFRGDSESSFTIKLTSELKAANIDGLPIFSVLNQNVVSSRIPTSSSQLSAIMNYGRKLGIQGVYYGLISPLEVTNRSWQEDREKCTEYKSFFKCKTKEKFKVICNEQIAVYSVHPKLVDIKTGFVIYTENISSSSTNKYCSDNGREFSNTDFFSSLQVEVAKKLRRHVAPYYDVLKVQLKNDTNGLSLVAVNKFKSAMAFSEADRMDRACAIWQELSVTLPESKSSISLLYNLGVCAEIVADYDRAIDLYSKADSMVSVPDKIIYEAKTRVLKLKNNQKPI